MRTCASARSLTIRAGAFIESSSSIVLDLFAQKLLKIKPFQESIHRIGNGRPRRRDARRFIHSMTRF